MTYSASNPDILSKDNSLEFDDNKVDQLFKIIKETFKRLFADGVIGLWAD